MTRRRRAGLAGALALSLVIPALAASDHALGDGTKTDNERLLPGIYPTGPVLASSAGLAEPYDPFLDVDWSVALRGTYTKATAGERFDIRLLPSVSLEHIGTRSAIDFDASSEITRTWGSDVIDVSALRLGLKTGYDLDSVTRATLNANFALTRQVPGSPGLSSAVAIAPQTLTGGVDAGLKRQFGKFNVAVTGAAQRSLYGTTTLTNGSVQDNSEQDYWALDSGLRVGFQATPIFELFGQGGIGRDIFDRPSTALGVAADATDYTARAGVTGRWNGTLEATASAGLGLRRFDAARLGEVNTELYDAEIIYTPDPTLRLRAAFGTAVTPPGPNGAGTTRVDYTGLAELGYTVNSWLALRASANWYTARFDGSSNVEKGQGLGVGADYKVNAHTAITADYAYDFADSTTNGVQDAQRLSMGVTLSR